MPQPPPCLDCGAISNHRKVCPHYCPTNKTRHPTAEWANRALESTRISAFFQRGRRRQEKRIYRCQLCRGWHLTSQDRRERDEQTGSGDDGGRGGAAAAG